ncbi:hypothetical protein ACIQNU_11025 [Streptomyces sp. NPDC091292]|uniref:hypothetical protein n=1 Tax=Streptomyces sp. NPDC091292 TaxID=3365991 RepID=UPI00380140A3
MAPDDEDWTASRRRLTHRGTRMQQPGSQQAEHSIAFAQVLDRALGTPEVSDATDRADAALGREQLRTEALAARATISAVAAPEYRRYLEVRAVAVKRRRAVRAPRPGESAQEASGGSDGARRKSGLLPALAVLVPSLAAVASVVFLLIGYGMRVLLARPYIGDGLVMAGLIAGSVAVGAALADLAWLLVAAARNRRSPDDGSAGAKDPEVRRAREAWQEVLLERGVLPFLRGRIEEARAGGEGDPGATPVPTPRGGRGFASPDYAGPEFGSPDFSSPDFSSPDFAGPGSGGADGGGPDFTGPDFSSPDFTGPGLPRSE